MSPQIPVTGLTDVSGSGLLIASSLIKAAKNVKIFRSQCQHLSRQCLNLASALRDHSDKLEGTAAQQAVDEVERVLTRILNRVRKWADLGTMRSFVKQTEIRLGLDESYRELKDCSMRFNITLHLEASSRSRDLEEIRRRDHEELVEMMTKVLHDKNLLKITLATSTREDAHSVVEAIEQELREADVGETQERQLQEEFGELRKWVEGLPPMVDLSGNVIRTSDHPIASGGSQDIYTGEWTGQEVALAYPRNQSRAGRERFQRQVEMWRTLRHPNILQLLGIASIGDFVYSVSPYMEFGHVTRFLKAYPDADRVLLLNEIASATEYLHINGIVHGDLQGSNVLISRDGHVCLGDFGSARVEEVPITEAITYGSLRWLAPELVADSSYIPTTRATDVHVSNEAFIPLVIRDGPLPTRPEHGNTKGLSDGMWNLMDQCWQRDPKSRPSMSGIRETIQNIHPMRSSSRSSIPSISNTRPGSLHRSSFSSAAGVPGGARPSGLTLSRPLGSTGLTRPLTMPKPLARDEPESEQTQRGIPASFPMRKYPILNIPLSSSPPSVLTSARSVPGKSIPYSQNPSPLSSSCRTPLPSTTPESRTSASSPSDRSDWSLKPPLLFPDPSASSNTDLSLLLQPITVTPSPTRRSGRRIGSTPTGSTQSVDKSVSTSSSGGLLEAAVQDTEPLLRRTADGTVEAGTLVGLIDRLIKDTHDRAKDDEFRRIFLATYPLFTTGEDLFRSLTRRFEEMGDVQSFIPSGFSRYSTLLVLRTWLEDGGEHWSRELLSSIREFARSIGGSDTMKAAVQEIANLVDERMNVVVVSPTPSLQSFHGTTLPSSLEQFKPEDIADSLTVIEGEFYSKITQADYIAHVRGTPITTHIASASKINNRLVNWVKLHIISYKDVNRRSTKFKYFVLIAEECRKSQNFSSMSAIVAALKSLSQLILTCDIELNKNEKQLLAQLDDILAPGSDHLAYRQALQNIESPIGAIPWLAVHLRSLQTFYDRSSSTVIIDQRPLINFIRCAKLLQRIHNIWRYHPAPSPPQPPPPPADPQAGKTKDKSKSKTKTKHKDKDKDKRRSSSASLAALSWVKNELDNPESVISLEQFEARVSELAQAERQSHERHEPELRFLGFAPPTTTTPRHHPRTSSPGSPSSRLSPGGGRMASLDSRLGKT